ncbi:MAG: 50S ribosomal protein L24 [Gammaproteobacteria bacterium]|nr:50S ribosomal protein L24 [Gammaproteobacteria bacterium]
MRKIKKGDKILVIAGRDKGKQGTVLSVSADDRVLVEGVNLVKKHVRPNPNKGITGGIVDQEATLHVSNVSLVNPITGKADRVGFKILEDGKKVRYFKSNGEIVDI